MRRRVYEVRWLDSMVDSNDYDGGVEEIKKKRPYVCERVSVGYYVCEDKEYFVMAEDISLGKKDEAVAVSGLISIPKGMIKRKKLLK